MNNVIQQGKFTSDGLPKTLKIRSEVNWIKIVNYTQHAAANNGYGVEYYWQNGMSTNTVMKYRPAGDQTLASNISASSIQVIDSSNFAVGSRIALTGGSNATRPVYTAASTGTMKTGDTTSIVRMDSSPQTNLNGLDFTVDAVTTDTTFRLANTLATAPGIVTGASGYFKVIAPNLEIYRMFTPSNRNIANVASDGITTVVTTLVDHGYAVGQRVKFKVPESYGMTQLDGLTGNITAVTAGPPNTFTVDIDSSAFTAFNFPVYTDTPFVHASVVPLGDNPEYSGYMTSPGSFYNQGFIGVVLTGGTTGPGGNADDVIYWMAGKSDRIDNE